MHVQGAPLFQREPLKGRFHIIGPLSPALLRPRCPEDEDTPPPLGRVPPGRRWESVRVSGERGESGGPGEGSRTHTAGEMGQLSL